MTSTAEVGSPVVARARGMRDLVRAEAAESERLRTLTPAIVDEMWASGLMSSFNPIPAGGVEPSFTEMIETWIEMAWQDGSFGWCGIANLPSTFAAGEGPFVRHRADLVIPETTRLEIAVLKGIAAHYVMRADDRVALMRRQRSLLADLVDRLAAKGPDGLDRPFADDWATAVDDPARRRVVIDQVASLTDASALSWHRRLTG